VAVHDAVASPAAARDEYGIELQPLDALPQADALVVAVAHDAYRSLDPAALNALVRPAGVVVDVKACLPRARIESAGYTVWRL
jgi:UDP-N-acetyl-D-galactosamine dehydrogenase